MCKIGARETRILLIRRRLEQPRGAHESMRLAVLVHDQVIAPQNLGNAHLGRLEVDALDVHDDVENRMRTLDAGAEGFCLVHVPPPGGMVVRVIGVGARDVRRAVLPTDAECAEHLRLAAFDCRLNRLGKDVALSHHPLWRSEHSARGSVARSDRWLPGT
jgi:hypothetical protein